MDIDQITKPLTDFFTEVSKMVTIDEMIVFGSYASGTAKQESDVDVVVVSDDFQAIKPAQRLHILDKASRFLRPEIVATGFTQEEMADFGSLTILGEAREKGLRFTPHAPLSYQRLSP